MNSNVVIPQHVAIVMDGNGRWAKEKGLPRTMGHKKGIEALRTAVESSVELGVNILTVYVFSTENWKRPQKEVFFLMKLFEDLIDIEVEKLHKNGVRVKFLGEIEALSKKLKKKISLAEEKTDNNNKLTLNVMINYGSRQEIISAIKSVARDAKDGKIDIDALSPNDFSGYLYTSEYPDPELLIRTGGQFRLSNYLLWQLSYSEIYVSDIYWPDFNMDEYRKAIDWFNGIDRRFGGLNDE